MHIMLFSIVKVFKCKSGPFKHALNISKWSAGSVYIGNVINYLIYLLVPFLRGPEVNLEGRIIFLTLMLSIYSIY